MKLGILYPRSNAHPEIDVDFVDGIKTCFKEKGLVNSVQIVMESVGFGGAEKEVYEKAEKLIRFEKVDMIVGFIDTKVISLLEPLFYSSGKLLLVVNAGANYPANWVPPANIIHLTLQQAFLSWLTGGLAAGEEKSSAAYASTFYDCGYLLGAAATKHFVKNGGEMMFNYINKDKYDDSFTIKPLVEFLTVNNGTRKVLCSFDETPSALFYDRLNSALIDDLELFVTPMMLQAKALAGLNDGFAFPITGFIPWHPTLPHEANRHFKTYFEEHAGRPATIFSLLGWEAGLIIEEIIQNSKDNYDAEGIIGHLDDTFIISPRGSLKLDPNTHFFLAPAIKCFIAKGATTVNMKAVKQLDDDWNLFTEVEPEAISSGWTNTYLCY